jgi:hypothetical protein
MVEISSKSNEKKKNRRSSAETGRITVDLSSNLDALETLKNLAKEHEHSLSVELRRTVVPILESVSPEFGTPIQCDDGLITKGNLNQKTIRQDEE